MLSFYIPDPTNQPCPSCSTSAILASVITAIITALLATVIFLLVTVAICKCRPMSTRKRADLAAEAGASARGEGYHAYEEIDERVGEMSVRHPSYLEIVANREGGGNAIEVKRNKAYSSRS